MHIHSYTHTMYTYIHIFCILYIIYIMYILYFMFLSMLIDCYNVCFLMCFLYMLFGILILAFDSEGKLSHDNV